MSIDPRDLQKLLDELEASRASRKRAWENLQEIRWVLKTSQGWSCRRRPGRRSIWNASWLKTVLERSHGIAGLLSATRLMLSACTGSLLTKHLDATGSAYAKGVQERNRAIDRAEGLMLQ
jgi:hypothetical protein